MMKSTSKKHDGFTLIEIVISMAIIAIISVGVYNSYLLLIRQTKAGQVKQIAALNGKQAIEEIIATTKNTSLSICGGELDLSDNIKLNGTLDNLSGTVLFDKDGKECSEGNEEYTATINLEKTQTKSGENIELNMTESEDDSDYSVYIGNGSSGTYYITDTLTDTSNEHDLPSDSSDNIVWYMYLETLEDNSKSITIKDYNGQKLIAKSIAMNEVKDLNLSINFAEYKEQNGVDINVYNVSSDTPNIYIQKDKSLTVNVTPRKGNINIYDNRSADETKSKIGPLYNINVIITNKQGETLFTESSKQNIDINQSIN
jgi:prepilin-type N-terminal cleavage/methylation domain-containing protein